MAVSQVPALFQTSRIPGLRIVVDRSMLSVAGARPRTLLVAPCESTASLPVKLPAMPDSLATIQALCGFGSPMVEAAEAIWTSNPSTELWIAWNGDGTTKAAGIILIGGSATGTGTLHIYINKVHHYRIAVAVGGVDTPTEIGAAIVAAFAADPDCPVTSVNTAGSVAITSKWGGDSSNAIDVRINFGGATAGEILPAGVTCDITEPHAGATDVSHADLIANIADDRYEHIVLGYSDTTSIGLWQAEIDRRWGAEVMLYSWATVATRATVGDLLTWRSSHPDWRLQKIGYEVASPNPPWLMAADYGAVCEYHRTLGPTGSPHQGCDGYPLLTCGATPKGSRFTKAQRETLLGAGVATVAYDSSEDCIIELEESSASTALQDTWISMAWNNYKISELTKPAYRNKALVSDEVEEVPVGCIQPKSIYAKYLGMAREAVKRGWFSDFSSYKAGLVVEAVPGDSDALQILETPTYSGQLRRMNNVLQFRKAA